MISFYIGLFVLFWALLPHYIVPSLLLIIFHRCFIVVTYIFYLLNKRFRKRLLPRLVSFIYMLFLLVHCLHLQVAHLVQFHSMLNLCFLTLISCIICFHCRLNCLRCCIVVTLDLVTFLWKDSEMESFIASPFFFLLSLLCNMSVYSVLLNLMVTLQTLLFSLS